MPPRARNVPLIVAASIGLVLLVSGTLGWLGWRLLSQEDALVRQRVHDRLEQAADALVAGFLRTIADTESWLAQIGSDLPGDVGAHSHEGSVLVMFCGADVRTQPAGVLAYLPASPPPAALDSALFLPSERLEFQSRDFTGAALLAPLATRRTSAIATRMENYTVIMR